MTPGVGVEDVADVAAPTVIADHKDSLHFPDEVRTQGEYCWGIGWNSEVKGGETKEKGGTLIFCFISNKGPVHGEEYAPQTSATACNKVIDQ